MRLDLLATRIQEFRRRFRELSAAEFSNRALVRFNRAVELDYCKRTKALPQVRSFSTVANQQQYTLDDSVMDVENMIWQPTINHITLRAKDRDTVQSTIYQTGTPYMFAMNNQTKQILIHPTPSASAQTTTLNGSLSVSATTITVSSTTSFGQKGRIKIDDEIISYTSTTSTTFTGCVRGVEGTVASSHTDTTTVTWNNIEASCFVKPSIMERIYATGTVAITVDTKSVTGTTTTWNTGRAAVAGNYLGVGSLETTPTGATFPEFWYSIASVTSDTALTLDLAYRQATETAGSHIITDKSDLAEETGEIILKGMLVIALTALRSPLMKDFKAEYDGLVGDGAAASFPEDYLPVQRRRMTGPLVDGPQANNAYAPYVTYGD